MCDMYVQKKCSSVLSVNLTFAGQGLLSLKTRWRCGLTIENIF